MTTVARRAGFARHRAAAAGCCAALALSAGCAAPGEGTSEAAATALPSSPSPSDEEAAALAAYTGMWDVVVAASHEGGGVPSELEDHAVGGALALMSTALEGARTAGAQVTGEPVLDPSVAVEGPDLATVDDCLDDSGWNLGVGSSSGRGPRLVEATLIHDGLAWRVSDLRIWEAGSC
ncbi:hypothetical protein HNR06_004077 [Nocardiopsis arvandica]|uniref:Lipoprotein n=1 Tax=Nocardiopsis sinuspersici TaxID=501010 RepID=A0A7Y9XF24_9ACTN|nr:hypothetical protein [Nocardiopsis sinuspersici]NYH54488.1 hypothetical protein [Nocardiopsis sinuspersici]